MSVQVQVTFFMTACEVADNADPFRW